MLKIIVTYSISAVYHMKETGWIKISSDNVLDLHYKYADEKPRQ